MEKDIKEKKLKYKSIEGISIEASIVYGDPSI
jgi:hypothetical protein